MGVCKLRSRSWVLDIFDDMEILSKILLKALEGGFIVVFKFGGRSRGIMKISHLTYFFVDDTILC